MPVSLPRRRKRKAKGESEAKPSTPEVSPTGVLSTDTVSQWGQVFFDLDNDGDQDLVVLDGGYENPHQLKLYENVGTVAGDGGGYFRDITERAGLAGERFRQFWWAGSAADYDNDGLIDLALTPLNAMVNYRMHIKGRGDGPDPSFTVPRERFFLLHNQGDGTFVEESAAVGVVLGSLELGDDAGISETKNPLWIDADNDGDQDLYVAGSPHFFFDNQGLAYDGAFRGFVEATHTHLRAPTHADKLVFTASAADFDQDGFEDLFLGYWNSGGSDVVLRNANGVLGTKNGEGGWQVGQVTTSLSVRNNEPGVAETQMTSNFGISPDHVHENTMGLAVGDINDDGFPDAFVGTGTPAWAEHDLLWLNAGNHRSGDLSWRGFTKHLIGAEEPDGAPKTHGHGAAFGDLDHNWQTDLLLNPGGFALTDTMLAGRWARSQQYRCEERGGVRGQCDSREMPVIYFSLDLPNAGKTDNKDTPAPTTYRAAVRLEGRFSNRDAVGAHVQLLPTGNEKDKATASIDSSGESHHHWWIHSSNGFGSQNSAWINLPLGSSQRRELLVSWPRGHVSRHVVSAWTREVLVEPEAAGTRPSAPVLRPRALASRVTDRALLEENRILKQRLAQTTKKQDL